MLMFSKKTGTGFSKDLALSNIQKNNLSPSTTPWHVVLLGIFVIISFVFIIFTLWRYGLKLLDDGYYYLQIAHYLGMGKGFTFDGINATNGFHPLWQLILVPVTWLAPAKISAAYAAVILQTLFFLGSGLFLYFVVYRLTGERFLSLLGPGMWILNSWFWNKGAVSGMETGLLIFLLGIVLFLFLKVLTKEAEPFFLGILLMLMVATRLDSVALVLCISIGFFILKRVRIGWITLIPSLVYLSAYFLINRLTFGIMFPISGYIKSYQGKKLIEAFFSRGSLDIVRQFFRNLYVFVTLNHRIPVPLLILGICLGAVLFIWFIKRSDGPQKAIIFVLSIFSFSIFVYFGVMYLNLLDAVTYYWIPIFYGLMIIFNIFVIKIPSRGLRSAMVVSSFLLLFFFNIFYISDSLRSYYFIVPEGSRVEYRAVQFLNTSIPETAIIGSWDSGYVGYFANKPVINLDGHVNNLELLEHKLENRWEDYIDKKGISYVANVDLHEVYLDLLKNKMGWQLVYYDYDEFESAATRFSVSPAVRQLEGKNKKEFYIFKRPSSPVEGIIK